MHADNVNRIRYEDDALEGPYVEALFKLRNWLHGCLENFNILRVDTLYLASLVCSCFFVQLLFIYGIILDVYLIGASGSNIEYTLNNVG